MSLRDRIGFDAGKTRLEDAVQWAIDNEFFFLDFNADAGPNHMDTWSEDRAREIRNMCESNGISIGLHTLSAVNVAEFSPHVSRGVDGYMRASVDLANQLGCSWTVVHAGYHFSGDVAERKKASLDRLVRICKYGADTAFNIHPAIAAGGAGFGGDRVEIFLFIHQEDGQRLEHVGSLMDGHLPQCRAAFIAPVIEHVGEIEAFAAYIADGFAINRIAYFHAIVSTPDPGTTCVTFNFHSDSPEQANDLLNNG